MRRGLRGINCCATFHVWGLSVRAPMVTSFNQSGATHVDYGIPRSMQTYAPGDDIRGGRGYNNPLVGGGTFWPAYAAKVPAYYPYHFCEKWPPISSADERLEADEQWSVELGPSIEKRILVGPPHGNESEAPQIEFVRRAVYSSRAIYVDGEQKYIVYTQMPNWNRGTELLNPANGNYEAGYPLDWKIDERRGWAQHIQIDIDSQEVVGNYNAQYLDGTTGVNKFTEITAMRQAWVWQANPVGPFLYPWTAASEICVFSPGSFAVQAHCFGKEYYVVSTYKPATSKATTIPDDIQQWSVGRLKYDGYEVFCSGTAHLVGRYHDGPYAILLPAVRADLRMAEEILQPDEPWVIARGYGGGVWKLVTGRWLNDDLRSGSGDMETGYADGTLSEGEVENIIYEGPDQPEVYCYNRVRGRDLVAFALLGEPAEENTFEPTADFEPADVGPGLINHGLPDGVVFTTKGEFGGGWYPRNDLYYLDPGTWNTHDPTKWGAKAESTPTFQGLVVLDIEINVVNNGSNLAFKWRLDNRATAELPPHVLQNIPASDGVGNHDTLEFSIDNNLVKSWDQTDADLDAEPFSIFQPFSLAVDAPSFLMSAGKHRLRWAFRRYTTANREFPTFAAIDNVEFPEITTADPEGAPWYYDGEEVHPVTYPCRPKRDDPSTVLTRETSNPHYIALDRNDHLWYGNPHGMIKLADDNITKEVEVQFTAVVGEQMPSLLLECRPDRCNLEECDDLISEIEQTFDPSWGCFQILPTRNYIQVRAANASIRDATLLPINFDHDTAGRWRFSLIPGVGFGGWNRRAHAWNISPDGTLRLPHIEAVFRFNMSIETFPFAPPYNIPPHGNTFFLPATSFPIGWFFHLLKNVEDIDPGEVDNRIDDHNWIVSRCYSDAGSRMPQYTWLLNPNADPGEEEWNPFDPFPSARAVIWPLYYPGTGSRKLDTMTNSFDSYHGNISCVKHVNEEEEEVDTPVLTLGPNLQLGPLADFDAVDCDCQCCEQGDQTLPFQGRQQGENPPFVGF